MSEEKKQEVENTIDLYEFGFEYEEHFIQEISMKLIVDKESIIYDYLRDNLNESKNTIKGFLSKRMVTINNKVVTKYDYKVHPKDEIMIGNTQIALSDIKEVRS